MSSRVLIHGQDGIWAAADLQDYEAVLSDLKEPLISSMAPADIDSDGFHPGVEFGADGISAFELWQLQKQRRALRAEYLSHWNATATATGTGRPVDAIICPAAAYPAPKHGTNNSAAVGVSDCLPAHEDPHCFGSTPKSGMVLTIPVVPFPSP